MKWICVDIILFLMGFIPEILLLKLDDGWKLLGLAYPVVTSILAFNWVSGFSMDICWMPSLALLITISPFFVGIAAAIVLWLLARLFTWLLKDDEE